MRLEQRKKFNLIIFSLLFLTLILRLPSFFEPPWSTDEGIYAASARLILKKRALPYLDFWDNKPPGIFLVFTIAEILSQVTKISLSFILDSINLLNALFLVLLIGKITKKLFPRIKDKTLFFSSLIFLLGFNLPFWEGNLFNAENIFLPFSTLTIYLLLYQEKKKNIFAAGFFLALALVIKQVVLAEFILACTLLLWPLPQQKNNNSFTPKQQLKRISTFLIGFLLPWLAAFTLMLTMHNLKAFFAATISYPFFYSRINLSLEDNLILWGLRLFLIGTSIFLYRFHRGAVSFSLLWLTLDLILISITLRPFTHYFLHLLPPLSLASANFSSSVAQQKIIPLKGFRILIGMIIFFLIFLSPLNLKWRLIPSVPYHFDYWQYWPNFIAFATGQKNLNQFQTLFRAQREWREEVEAVLKNQEPGTVFILAGNNEPWLYYQLIKQNFTPSTPYLASFYWEILPQGKKKLFQALEKNKTDYLILGTKFTPPELISSELFSFYTPISKKTTYTIWQYQN